MHISLTICIIYLELLVLTQNVAMEGMLSQIVYTPPSSFFIKCRKNIIIDNQKGPLFLHKIKTGTKKKNLRHSSLDMDVSYTYTKF